MRHLAWILCLVLAPTGVEADSEIDKILKSDPIQEAKNAAARGDYAPYHVSHCIDAMPSSTAAVPPKRSVQPKRLYKTCKEFFGETMYFKYQRLWEWAQTYNDTINNAK